VNFEIPSKQKIYSLSILLSAYLLVAHGSSDRRSQTGLIQLGEQVRAYLWHPTAVNPKSTSALVGTATLELALMPLQEQICQFSQQALTSGCQRLAVLPLFLLPGVHALEDVPREVAIAKNDPRIHSTDLQIDLLPYLGSCPHLVNLLAAQQATAAAEGWILLSHGSRRLGANQAVEAIALQLGALPAYWSVSPSLESQVGELVRLGCRRIGILPYFLFPGGITDAIAQSIINWQGKFSGVEFILGEPIAANLELAKMLGQEFLGDVPPDFGDVPPERLYSKFYDIELAKTIDNE